MLGYGIIVSSVYPFRADIQRHGRPALCSWRPVVDLLSRFMIRAFMTMLTPAEYDKQQDANEVL